MFFGIKFVSKLGLLFFAIVLYTMLSFYLGLSKAPRGVHPASLTGLSWTTFKGNWSPGYPTGKSFSTAVSLFFPCFTGILRYRYPSLTPSKPNLLIITIVDMRTQKYPKLVQWSRPSDKPATPGEVDPTRYFGRCSNQLLHVHFLHGLVGCRCTARLSSWKHRRRPRHAQCCQGSGVSGGYADRGWDHRGLHCTSHAVHHCLTSVTSGMLGKKAFMFENDVIYRFEFEKSG